MERIDPAGTAQGDNIQVGLFMAQCWPEEPNTMLDSDDRRRPEGLEEPNSTLDSGSTRRSSARLEPSTLLDPDSEDHRRTRAESAWGHSFPDGIGRYQWLEEPSTLDSADFRRRCRESE